MQNDPRRHFFNRVSTRGQILGVWRPTKPVQRDPLVLTDSHFVPDCGYADLSRDRAYGVDAKFAVTMLRNGAERAHHWHYLIDMRPEEVFVFRHFDSKRELRLGDTRTLPLRFRRLRTCRRERVLRLERWSGTEMGRLGIEGILTGESHKRPKTTLLKYFSVRSSISFC